MVDRIGGEQMRGVMRGHHDGRDRGVSTRLLLPSLFSHIMGLAYQRDAQASVRMLDHVVYWPGANKSGMDCLCFLLFRPLRQSHKY